MVVLIFSGIFLFAAACIGFLLSSPPYRGPVSAHFNGKRFFNPEAGHIPGPCDMIRFITGGPGEKWQKSSGVSSPLVAHSPEEEGIRYLGHASFLITLSGKTILLDPVFHRAGPLGIFGPSRFRKPGILLKNLPRIDGILVSHNHYDHFDVSAVKSLIKKDNPWLLMPLGCGNVLPEKFRVRLHELDWWEKLEQEGLCITAVPARHFSGRGIFDRNRSLWCGFMIVFSNQRIYFAGDTAYGVHFRQIAEKFPGISSALLPIGAYRPEWMMHGIHINPSDAIRAFLDLEADRVLAYHHRTFRLAREGPDTPEQEFVRAAQKRGVAEQRVLAPLEGELLHLNS